ncbi:hypothetical protein F6A46_11385 [Tenacibaculum finnmarkense genomovar ulcerans]|uniref:arylamine N-acetyltransferase n=1 Tax=Tenacibaculum finnmarkense TaxID=2781243 RepID=UPI00187B70D2|nr:arylamine N-acetyltransferase [Tenacibaculum finnmarkense]MBE7688825.1 hypothetical protein [Tenacibaculum finnmarkense genomovar ulcerans]
MKLSKTEISTFFNIIHVNKDLRDTSLDFLNLIIESVAKYIPWQNIYMIDNGLGKIPTFEDIKRNMLSGNGGICLDINRFMFYLLTEIGYDVQYILCGRLNAEKRHIAIISYFNNNPYFIDFGDAQPYYQAFNINDNKIILRDSIEYQFQNLGSNYQLLIKKDNQWNISYEFNMKKYNEIDFSFFIQKYYTDINYGPFWKTVHFAYYPNKKLRAIKGTTILYEKENGEICTLKHYTIEQFNISLTKCFDKDILVKYNFDKKITKLKKITQNDKNT